MSISKFYRLGAHVIRNLAVRAPTFSSATSYSTARNQYVQPQRHCSTASEVDSEDSDEEPKCINVTFVDKNGKETHVKVPEGYSMLEAAHENDIDLEGACEGSLSCSTCHVYVMDVHHYNKLPDPNDDENDLLDMAPGLTDTSRLGCQIIATPELDGLRLKLPSLQGNYLL